MRFVVVLVVLVACKGDPVPATTGSADEPIRQKFVDEPQGRWLASEIFDAREVFAYGPDF